VGIGGVRQAKEVSVGEVKYFNDCHSCESRNPADRMGFSSLCLNSGFPFSWE